MNTFNYILIVGLDGQRLSVPVQREITDVVEIQGILDTIDSRKYGELGYALVRGNPTFVYNGRCEVTYYINNEGVRISGINTGETSGFPVGGASYNFLRLRKEDFVEESEFVWSKTIAVDDVLHVIDGNLGLGLNYEVQVGAVMAMKWQGVTTDAEYDLVLQRNPTEAVLKVLFSEDVYDEGTQLDKVEVIVKIRL